MSSGNFASEVEDSARGLDNNMAKVDAGDPSPSQVMQGHAVKKWISKVHLIISRMTFKRCKIFEKLWTAIDEYPKYWFYVRIWTI